MRQQVLVADKGLPTDPRSVTRLSTMAADHSSAIMPPFPFQAPPNASDGAESHVERTTRLRSMSQKFQDHLTPGLQFDDDGYFYNTVTSK